MLGPKPPALSLEGRRSLGLYLPSFSALHVLTAYRLLPTAYCLLLFDRVARFDPGGGAARDVEEAEAAGSEQAGGGARTVAAGADDGDGARGVEVRGLFGEARAEGGA